MDPLSLTVSSITLVEAAARLAQSCYRLYQFWESLREAPGEVEVIKNDLMLLTNVLRDISKDVDLSPSVTLTLEACNAKVEKLEAIVGEFASGSQESPLKQERLWTKFRMTAKLKQLEKFRKGLSEIRSTLMLGLMYQNIQKPSLCFTNEEVQIVQLCVPATTDTKSQLSDPILTKASFGFDTFLSPSQETTGPQEPSATTTTFGPNNDNSSVAAIVSNKAVQSFLQHSLHLAVDNLIASGTVQQLIDSTLYQVTSFDTVCAGSYNSDSYNIRGVPVSQRGPSTNPSVSEDSTRKRPHPIRSRVCHQKSSIGVVLGSIWIRTSTLKAEVGANASAGNLEIITSFIFYPALWLTKIGLRYGMEANLEYSSTTGWKFNVMAVRAVPESSLIFELCRQGNVQAVQLMLTRGDASVKDTSPKGWTPLHFAAASGHVDLCAALIEAGAEKTALAYEGPTEHDLTPIAIWSKMCPTVPVERVRMMRLFGADCLDISEVNSDGWIVLHNLAASMSREKAHMTETSVTWVYRQKQTEIFVTCGVNSVWHGLQQAVRAFLIQEHESQVTHHLLRLDQKHQNLKVQSRISAIGHWLALRVIQRHVLPLILQSGHLLGIKGFDSFEGADAITNRQLVRLFPYLWRTWAKAIPQTLENVKLLVEAELDFVLGKLSIDRESLARCIQMASKEPPGSRANTQHKCLTCGDDYANLGTGLVQPRKISFKECRITGHKFYCQCPEFLRALGMMQGQPVADSRDIDEVNVDEEFFKETEDDVDQLCEEYDRLSLDGKMNGEPFHDAATMLYRAQGRSWIGLYEPSELLCATCFLKREEYIGENGPIHDRFTPVPKHYISPCSFDPFTSTF